MSEQPSVFLSSTYQDLKDIRQGVFDFLVGMHYQPVAFEKGGIYFEHHVALDESCYEAVSHCDMFVLLIGSRYGSPASTASPDGSKINSIVSREWRAAREQKLPIFVFVKSEVDGEYRTWLRNRHDQAFRCAHVDNPKIFELLHKIRSEDLSPYIWSYSSLSDITSVITSQLSMLTKRAIQERSKRTDSEQVAMNPFKLYSYRKQAGISLADLASNTATPKNKVRNLENAGKSIVENSSYSVDSFKTCTLSELRRIETCLDAKGRLEANESDDFSSHYVHEYAYDKLRKHRESEGRGSGPVRVVAPLFPTRAVVFDFDGTLTTNNGQATTWEMLWTKLGYRVQDCARFHAQFSAGEITHSQWCEVTRDHFRDRGITRETLIEVAHSIELMPEAIETVGELMRRGIRVDILSGSIKMIIREVLGTETCAQLGALKANEFVFDDNTGQLVDIRGTPYDFEHKASYLANLAKELNTPPIQIMFVGNSHNDKHAYQSGATTLLINPIKADPSDRTKWTFVREHMPSLSDLLDFVKFD